MGLEITPKHFAWHQYYDNHKNKNPEKDGRCTFYHSNDTVTHHMLLRAWMWFQLCTHWNKKKVIPHYISLESTFEKYGKSTFDTIVDYRNFSLWRHHTSSKLIEDNDERNYASKSEYTQI